MVGNKWGFIIFFGGGGGGQDANRDTKHGTILPTEHVCWYTHTHGRHTYTTCVSGLLHYEMHSTDNGPCIRYT